MQICLNTFLVAYLVSEHGFSLAAAGLALAVAQFGGFVGRLGFWLIIGPRLGVMTLLLGIGFGMTAAGLATGLAAGVLSPVALAATDVTVVGLSSAQPYGLDQRREPALARRCGSARPRAWCSSPWTASPRPSRRSTASAGR